MRKTLATVAATAIVLATPLTAAASTSKAKDGNDIDTPLDLASVVLKSKGKKIKATLTMHDAFTDDALAAPNMVAVDFKIGKMGTRGAVARYKNGVLTGNVCTYTTSGKQKDCSAIKAKRVDERTVQMTFKRKQISKAPVLRWRAGTLIAQCSPFPECADFVPGGLDDFKSWRV